MGRQEIPYLINLQGHLCSADSTLSSYTVWGMLHALAASATLQCCGATAGVMEAGTWL